ncbi:MAG: hypothetical protein JWO60_2258 [Frankiales bacterium]|nr:hypothetical protein [Frankiales bacterium]
MSYGPAVLRPRRPADLPALLALLQRTHEQEGYPVRQVAVSDWWLASEDELWSAVAEQDGRLLGHVALHPPDPAGLAAWTQAAGRPVEGLAMVSRLFTDRSVPGTGSALLDAAVAHACAVDRVPVLQVDPEAAALDFYLRRSWWRAGTVQQQWGHRTVDAVLLVAPRA